MQGHSHVSMSVSPSGVDEGHRAQILDQLDEDMFYIFMVWNKRLETHTLIYDMANNVLYEDSDVTVKILGDDSMDEFLADAKEKVQKKKTATYRSRAKRDKVELTPPPPQGSIWDRYYAHACGMYDPYEL
jgi:hypothetical protein